MDDQKIKRTPMFMYAMPHKRKKIKAYARMEGYSDSAWLNRASDFYMKYKEEEFVSWLQSQQH